MFGDQALRLRPLPAPAGRAVSTSSRKPPNDVFVRFLTCDSRSRTVQTKISSDVPARKKGTFTQACTKRQDKQNAQNSSRRPASSATGRHRMHRGRLARLNLRNNTAVALESLRQFIRIEHERGCRDRPGRRPQFP